VPRPEPKTADSKHDEEKSLAAKACPKNTKLEVILEGSTDTTKRRIENQESTDGAVAAS
jgi:hypothetical protein